MRTLHPYPIPDEEGDGGSLISNWYGRPENRYFCGPSERILLSEWKSKNDFLLAEVLGRFVGSRKEQNHKRTRLSGSSMICSISFFCLALSWEADSASSYSIPSGIVTSSHLRRFGVKT